MVMQLTRPNKKHVLRRVRKVIPPNAQRSLIQYSTVKKGGPQKGRGDSRSHAAPQPSLPRRNDEDAAQPFDRAARYEASKSATAMPLMVIPSVTLSTPTSEHGIWPRVQCYNGSVVTCGGDPVSTEAVAP
jgi:hypothetical protein